MEESSPRAQTPPPVLKLPPPEDWKGHLHNSIGSYSAKGITFRHDDEELSVLYEQQQQQSGWSTDASNSQGQASQYGQGQAVRAPPDGGAFTAGSWTCTPTAPGGSSDGISPSGRPFRRHTLAAAALAANPSYGSFGSVPEDGIFCDSSAGLPSWATSMASGSPGVGNFGQGSPRKQLVRLGATLEGASADAARYGSSSNSLPGVQLLMGEPSSNHSSSRAAPYTAFGAGPGDVEGVAPTAPAGGSKAARAAAIVTPTGAAAPSLIGRAGSSSSTANSPQTPAPTYGVRPTDGTGTPRAAAVVGGGSGGEPRGEGGPQISFGLPAGLHFGVPVGGITAVSGGPRPTLQVPSMPRFMFGTSPLRETTGRGEDGGGHVSLPEADGSAPFAAAAGGLPSQSSNVADVAARGEQGFGVGKGQAASGQAATAPAEAAGDCSEPALPTPNWPPPAQRPSKEDSEDWGMLEPAAAIGGPRPTSPSATDLCSEVATAAGGMYSPPSRQVALEQVSPRDCSPSCARDMMPPLIQDSSPVGSPLGSPTSDLMSPRRLSR